MNINDYIIPIVSILIVAVIVGWIMVGNQIMINDNRKHAKKSGYDVDENSYS